MKFGQLENGQIEDNVSGNEIDEEKSKIKIARLQDQLIYFTEIKIYTVLKKIQNYRNNFW